MFHVFIDISALLDRHYTGIPRVVYEITRYWLQQKRYRRSFFLYDTIVPQHIIEILIQERGAVTWPRAFLEAEGKQSVREAVAASREPTVGLFARHRKTCEPMFDINAQIVYDLTPIIMADTHSETLVEDEGLPFLHEMRESDLLLPISETTAQHLALYCKIAPEKMRVIFPGADFEEELESDFLTSKAGLPTRDFVLVLGTLEERKNLGVVFQALAANPALTERYTWIFAGRVRPGFFDRFRPEVERLLPAIRSKRIIFSGYIDELVKYALLKKATFVVYPSLFEGFGLPVAEALWLGKPVLTTYATSIPEVGGDAAYYFDPTSPVDFIRVLRRLERDLAQDAVAVRQRSVARGQSFSWLNYNERLSDILVEEVEARFPNAAALLSDEIKASPEEESDPLGQSDGAVIQEGGEPFIGVSAAAEPNLRSQVDAVAAHTALGWAWRPDADLNTPVEVALIDAQGRVLVSTLADIFRPDLLNHGIGSGCHHFRLPIPLGVINGPQAYYAVAALPSRQLLQDGLLLLGREQANNSLFTGHIDSVHRTTGDYGCWVIEGEVRSAIEDCAHIDLNLFVDGEQVEKGRAVSLADGDADSFRFSIAIADETLKDGPNQISLYAVGDNTPIGVEYITLIKPTNGAEDCLEMLLKPQPLDIDRLLRLVEERSFSDAADFIYFAYSSVLRRSPDEAGARNFESLLRSGKITQQRLLLNLAESAEAQAIYVGGAALPAWMA